jgi:hypothetical protein
MNWKPTPLAASLLSVIGLASCVPFQKKDGVTISYPTVSDMARYDAQWGLPPKPEAAPESTSTHTATITPSTAPAETTPPATPPAVPPTLR